MALSARGGPRGPIIALAFIVPLALLATLAIWMLLGAPSPPRTLLGRASAAAACSEAQVFIGSHSHAHAAHEVPAVLVLTPVKNAAGHLPRFFRNLQGLDYPRERLAIGLLYSDSDDVPSSAALEDARAAGALNAQVAAFLASTDASGATLSGTAAALLAEVPRLLAQGYARVTIVRHDFGVKLARAVRHEMAAQGQRRAAMARSRNHLLVSSLRESDEWVLWVDSDLHSYPADALRQLLSSGRQIVVPNVVMEPGGRSFDLNSWRLPRTPNNATLEEVRSAHAALAAAAAKRGEAPEALHLEGYTKTGALYLHQLRKQEPGERVVRLDAVGGGMLLIDAELHRHGLTFPSFPHRHRIETEGLSMIGLDMGVLSYGMPSLEVVHK